MPKLIAATLLALSLQIYADTPTHMDISEWATFGWGVPACPKMVSAAMSEGAIMQRQAWVDASVSMLNIVALGLTGHQAVNSLQDMHTYLSILVGICAAHPDTQVAAATTNAYITMLEDKFPGAGKAMQRKLLGGCQ